MPVSLKREVTGDRQVNSLQANAAASTQQLREGPFGDGNLVTGQTFAHNTATKVNTGLGRAMQGWVLVRFQNTTLGGSLVETTSDSNSVTFLSNGASTASIWFW